MAITTCDILLEGIRRDTVFEWLSDVANHQRIIQGAFDGMDVKGPGNFELQLKTTPLPVKMSYEFDRPDDSHGGRRILVHTGGRRTKGQLSYSLRTMKPSTNTLVTAHMDYTPGRLLGPILDGLSLNKKLEGSLRVVLENLSREIPRES